MPEITYENWNDEIVSTILEAQSDYLDILKWAYKAYNDDIVYACSFGAEGIVLIDLIHKVNKGATIIFLDTGLHFSETYELIDQVKAKYPTLNIQMVKPKISLEEQTEKYGDQLWKKEPNLCCQLRKVADRKSVV